MTTAKRVIEGEGLIGEAPLVSSLEIRYPTLRFFAGNP